MRRLLLLSLSLLLLLGCTAQFRATYRELRAEHDALQNPAYPGDANKDLVPYQARSRDLTTCTRAKETDAAIDAADTSGMTSSYDATRLVWRVIRDCMAAKGWR
jgi:hypothetical protein